MDMLRLQSSSKSSPNEMMDKAKNVWNMLDELASSDPTAYKKFIEKTIQEGKEYMAPPTPCLAVQSVLHSHPNIKIFYLNIFTWLRLPAPTKTDELTKMYSLSPTEITHNYEQCILVNIAVHPDVIKIIGRTQLIRSTFDLVVSQHKLLVDYNNYKYLDEKALGDIEEIQRNFLKPLTKTKKNDEDIDELLDSNLSPSLLKELSSMTSSNQSTSSNKLPSSQQQPKKTKKPAVLIEELWTTPTYTEEITNNNSFLIIRISLPECESVADCDVTVLPTEETIHFECTKLHMHLKLDMKKRKKPNISNCNSLFDIQRLTAKFVRKTQHLILSIPIIVEQSTHESKNNC
ncbi:unnamed protein product [Rotaria magnacalcarata]|uniref:PIH1 domain-containing protein 2 n=1 Tax=Rotaria magnacalcarata TaxID=392030 RepID=A0A816P9A3_9BILA|nr:unnamed protein product [Rotaria magnacalcarata]CAF2071097.1 unnamed protein product [Rotaria magnacalcarata]CAF2108956.1 unnamed protein product [Rotaria magnacalcarata]CAF3750765.1 unnamed protein product [Rotaria magnacalcarata]CAF3855073.1 unnamed protein product [Rotaria magnacalcarata]